MQKGFDILNPVMMLAGTGAWGANIYEGDLGPVVSMIFYSKYIGNKNDFYHFQCSFNNNRQI